MAAFGAGLFIAFLFLLLFLHVFSLPANWIIIVLAGIWRYFHPEMDTGYGFFVVLALIAGIGEVMEFLAQSVSVKRYGGSRKANWWSIIGAIVGAIAFAPFLFGVGAILGGFLGAFAAALLAELSLGRNRAEAVRSAKGAVLGKALGFITKASLGVVIVVMFAHKAWPA